MLKTHEALTALVLTCVSLICGVHSAALFIPTGRDKDAWPELLNKDWEEAQNAIINSGLVQNVYVQHPWGTPPSNVGKPTDVWLYTDNSIVYEIPRRGVWHANRLVPGWPEVTGLWYKSAIVKIKNDYLGVSVFFGPNSVIHTADLRMDRVYVVINATDGTIVGIPSIG